MRYNHDYILFSQVYHFDLNMCIMICETLNKNCYPNSLMLKKKKNFFVYKINIVYLLYHTFIGLFYIFMQYQ